jgi:hypothetical protein
VIAFGSKWNLVVFFVVLNFIFFLRKRKRKRERARASTRIMGSIVKTTMMGLRRNNNNNNVKGVVFMAVKIATLPISSRTINL